MKTLSSVLLAFGLALSTYAQGYVEGIVDHTDPVATLNDGTIGYTFRANANMSVSDIGVFAYILESTTPMRVGIWDSAGNLLAESTISITSQLVGAGRYQTLASPLPLVEQQVYHIGAWFPSTFGYRLVGGAFGGSVTTSPGITVLGYVRNASGFAFPTAVDNGAGIVALTGNILIPSVPEPSSISLCLLGLLGFAKFRARRSL